MIQSPYYECHITLTEQTDSELERLRKYMSGYASMWHISSFLLLPDLPAKTPKMFVSARHEDYRVLHAAGQALMRHLTVNGFQPTRIKIEATIFDLKF